MTLSFTTSRRFIPTLTSLSKVLQALRRFSMELNKPQSRWQENQIRSKIQRWLSGPFLEQLVRYQIESQDGHWRLQFEFDTAAWQRLVDHRLGRTVLLTNRMDWSAEQVAMGYSGQQEVERVFRGLKDGDWLGWGPMYHWTDRKIRIHAFYCMLGISLLQHLHKQAQAARRHRALQTDPHSTSLGQNPRFGSIAYYPTWVIPFAGRNLLTAQCITALSTSPGVNSR